MFEYVGTEVSIWGFKLIAGGDHDILLRMLSKSQLSKAEVSGGVVNTSHKELFLHAASNEAGPALLKQSPVFGFHHFQRSIGVVSFMYKHIRQIFNGCFT